MLSNTLHSLAVSAALVAPLAAQQSVESSLEELLSVEIETAAKYHQKASEAPASVTVVTAEEIRAFGYRTLAEVLNHVRGFYTSSDRVYGYLGARGFSRPTDYNSRVLILLNGQRVNENFYQTAGIEYDVALNLDAVERIEVVRGPGSALYGSGAMFGVINIISKTAAQQSGSLLRLEAGSFGRQQAQLTYGADRGEVGVTFSGLWGDRDGEDFFFEELNEPLYNHGISRDSDWDQYAGGLFRLEYRGLEIQTYHSTRRKGIPTSAFEIDLGDPDNRTLDEYTHFQVRYRRDLGPDKDWSVTGYSGGYYYDGVYLYEGAPFIDVNDSRWWGVESQLTWDVSAANRLVVGAEYQENPQVAYLAFDEDLVYFDDDIPYDALSLYVQDSFQLTRDLALTLGLRLDDYSDVGSSTNPRFALVYHPFATSTFKALYGEAFRRPNHYERFYEDNTNKANPDVEPEEIRTAELIWEQELTRRYWASFSAYTYSMNDLITAAVDPVDDLVQFRNLEEVDSAGFEMELRARFAGGAWGYASYGYQKTEAESVSGQLSNSPQHLVRLGFSFPLQDRISAAVQLRWESERISVYDTELDGYLLADLHLTTHRLTRHFDLALHVLNAFDESYEVPGGFEHVQDGLAQPGRDVRLSLEVGF